MKRRFYVASRASIPDRPKMWKELRERGLDIVSSWIDEAGEGETDNFSELWCRIISEIDICDVLILYTEENDFPLKGAFVEVGAALALGKQIYAVMKDYEPNGYTSKPIGSWINHPNVKCVKSLEDCFVDEDFDEEVLSEFALQQIGQLVGIQKITRPTGEIFTLKIVKS